jgi:ectoine hydroxylase-related dioxygenase (phytanoyl-CoA dioxygenase family)
MVFKEQREEFAREGYLVFETGIADAVLDGIVSDLAGQYPIAGASTELSYQGTNRLQDAWRISANVKAVALAPKILNLLEGLYGRQPLPFQTLNFRTGTEQPPHSDAIHFNSIPEKFMCAVWVALEDMDMDNGPLVYYSGSHKLPEVRVDDLIDVEGSFLSRLFSRSNAQPPMSAADIYPVYKRFVAERIKDLNLSAGYATIKKGQALLWATNLLHGGAPQKDKTRSRHSQVTHYFFAGCRYYTPILSRGKNITWRDPSWVK